MTQEDRTATWLRIIRGEYCEIPGLLLTRRDAQRLWHLDSVTCGALLEALEDAGFLRRTRRGAYVKTCA